MAAASSTKLKLKRQRLNRHGTAGAGGQHGYAGMRMA